MGFGFWVLGFGFWGCGGGGGGGLGFRALEARAQGLREVEGFRASGTSVAHGLWAGIQVVFGAGCSQGTLAVLKLLHI